MAARLLVAEVVVLQRNVQFAVLQRGDGILQIVAFLAGDTHFIAIDLALNLKLGVFKHLSHEPGIVFVETLGHGETLTFDLTSALNVARHKGPTVHISTSHLAA